ncbi:MAG: ATP-dependent DNA helicase RecG [Lachnospiraceae bacterium]
MNLDSGIRELKGIGAKTEELFCNLGVYTIRDILLHFPREYHRFEQPKTPDEVKCGIQMAVCGRIRKTPLVKRNGRMAVTTAAISGESVTLSLIWFRMPYLKNTLKPGMTYVFYGIVKQKNNQLVMEQPKVYTPEQYREISDSLQPVYALTKGLTNNQFRKAEKQALEELYLLEDFLPKELIERHDFYEYGQAVYQMHFPQGEHQLKKARNRLAYTDFFEFILMMQMSKENRVTEKNGFIFEDKGIVEKVIEQLPYPLTNAQKKTIRCVREDMRGEFVMQRLIQGDVGSGKTIVAFLAMIDAASNGYQSAIMAPTEVLARQHYENFTRMCEDYGLEFPVILLTGSMTAKQKRDAYERMLLYKNALIVGTHALIQEKAVYENLALVITDEQHRFGVKQRETLGKKGQKPHILVMSATPIPRTLAIILYGDLDISVIDEVPAQRLPIKNCVVGTEYRPKAYSFIQKQVEMGHQVYVICPLVEESENTEAENVTDYTKILKEELPGVRVACLHGKMKPALKNQIMEDFLNKEFDVLVSTTVIEVGVNVPNATVMMIEDAQRFGLAQLHQLRGRVGRSDIQSYCIMINTSESKESKKRLDILNSSNDGFYIAREDLKLRGQGDFFGVRQSGEMEFAVGDIFADANLLQEASEDVKMLLEKDPELKLPEHENLKRHMEEYGAAWFEKINL